MNEIESSRPDAALMARNRIRTEDEIRGALRRMCDTVWNKAAAREPFWHIPVDLERDVDVILYDAFDELKRYRAAFGPLPVT